VDYWAVDFDYMHRKEIIKVPIGAGLSGVASLAGFEPPQGDFHFRNSRNVGLGAIFLKTNGRASARAKTAISN
jgi:hypothetical protein